MSPPLDDSHDLAWTFSTLGYSEANLDGVAQLARQFRIPRVELRTLEGRTDLPALFTERFGSPAAMATWLKEEGLEVVSLDSSARIIGCSPSDRDELLEFGHWAEGLGIPAIRVFDGGHFQSEIPPAERDEAIAFYAWWRRQRHEHGWSVNLMVETHDALITADPCLQLAKLIGEDFAILWDAHHTWCKGGEAPEATWQALRPWIRHIHFKDSIPRPSEGQPMTFTPLGKGDYPLAKLFELLRQANFKGPVSLEWERHWHPSLTPLVEVLPRLDQWRNGASPTVS